MHSSKRKGKKSNKGPWPKLQESWGLRTACNFIGGGTGSGLLIIAAVLSLLGEAAFILIITGLFSLFFGLLMVFMEIGRPWRSINVFFHPQTSWMTREAILVIPIVLCSVVLLLNMSEFISSIAAILLATSAAAFLYSQMNMLHASKGIPAWCHLSLKPYIYITGIVEAFGIAVCISAFASHVDFTPYKEVWLVLGLLLIGRFFLWQNYAKKMHQPGIPVATGAEIERVYLVVLLSHLVSGGLLITAAVTDIALLAAVAGLLAATSGWFSKVVIVTRAAQTRGFSIPRTPVRGQGQSRVFSGHE
jgi:phenylacetyl-CoA:acceptor oxidoreductase 26-kDa subunit